MRICLVVFFSSSLTPYNIIIMLCIVFRKRYALYRIDYCLRVSETSRAQHSRLIFSLFFFPRRHSRMGTSIYIYTRIHNIIYMSATFRVITMTYGRYKFSLAPAGTRIYPPPPNGNRKSHRTLYISPRYLFIYNNLFFIFIYITPTCLDYYHRT